VHAPLARGAGLSDDEIDAIRRGADAPTFSTQERVVREVITALFESRGLRDELYREALERLGLVLLHHITMQAGYYSLLYTMLTTFDGPLPEDASPVFASATQM
jgi:4-carboxymuconolactone decarboxylase